MTRLPKRKQTSSSSIADFNLAGANRFRSTSLVPSGDCLLWTGPKLSNGYGYVAAPLGYYRLGKWYAHRVSYFMATGTDPGAMVVRHKCDNPPCCNPDHLELGTQGDNIRDAVERGRLDTSSLQRYLARREAVVVDRIQRGVGWCGRCKQELLADRFGSSKRSRSGLAGTCKQCASEYSAQRRKKVA